MTKIIMKLNTRTSLILANLLLGFSLEAAVNFSIDPSTIGDNYLGNVTLRITGIGAGESVTVQKYLDANGNGVIDAGDLLVQQYPLTDGKASVIGGVTNINVAADTDSVPGQITANWNLHSSGLEQRFAGKYLFSVSSSGFSAVTLLTITNSATAQSISGVVQLNGTSVPNAAVLLFSGSVSSSTFVAGAMADNSGNYTVKAAPGTYTILALKPGYVTDSGGTPPVTLPPGGLVTTNLEVLPPTRTISGRFVDSAVLGPGLGGIFVVCESQQGFLAVGTTDGSGNYSIPVIDDIWQLAWDSGVLPVLGYVDVQQEPIADTTAGNVTGLTVSFPKGKALVYGTLKDDQGHPIQGVQVFGDDDSGTYEGTGTTDASGNYVVAIADGSWWVSPDTSSLQLANYIVSVGADVTAAANQAVQQNFTAVAAPYTISGKLLDVTNGPVANVGIYGRAVLNGIDYSQYVDTASDGSWSFAAAPGAWSVGVNCSSGSDSLTALKYGCVDEVPVTITSGSVTTNFTVGPCGAFQITSSATLPIGRVGFYYEVLLAANGCNQPFIWSVAPGSQPLPAGLTLDTDGTLSGYPTASGPFSFTVRVTDGMANHLDQTVSVSIAPVDLEIVTATLPPTQTGLPYSQQLAATGGQLPYTWSLAPGSDPLPPGVTLNSAGLLSGTFTIASTFFFDAQVTDALGSNAVQNFALTVTNIGLAVATTTLPNATVGLEYSFQLTASGGQAPYTWTVAGPGSLPSWLTLSADGVLFGQPDTAGPVNFAVQVTDDLSATAVQSLNLQVNGGTQVDVGAPQWSPTGQFSFEVLGTAGQTYTVMFSTDLKTWTPLQTTNAPTDLISITIPNPPAPRGYYRVKVGP